MRVDLRTVKDNPRRDFTVDPINPDLVEQLRQSIHEDGFWGGIVARKNGKDIELAAGHHRLRAALLAGETHADIFVGKDIDDLGMIRIYARENATQRGNSSTAITGTVASAVRFLAKALMTNGPLPQEFLSQDGFAKALISLTSDRGIGQTIIVRLLNGVPGINDGTVQQQLANLKASGDYARIIGEVKAEIEAENAAEMARAAEQERQRLEWEAEQKRLEEERAEKRRIAEEQRRQAEADRQARIEEAKKREIFALAARKQAEAEAKSAKAQAERERAQLAAIQRRADADRERERIAEEKRQAKIEAERQKKLAAEQAERERAEKALADKRRKELAKEAEKFEALRKTQQTADKAAAKAAEREKTFDFSGVAKHFANDHQISVFRDAVTPLVKDGRLPVEQQATLAEELVRYAKEGNRELSGAFIREHVMSLLLSVKTKERALDRDEQQRLELASIDAKMARLIDDFSRNGRGMASAATQMKEMMDKHPNHRWKFGMGFRNAVRSAKSAIDSLYARM